MYNGIGLQTPRGSGSNGYIQTNKFFMKPKSGKVSLDHKHVFGGGEGTAGLSKKPNTDILEHDKKRQIEVKLLLLEENLIEQGCSQSHIHQKLTEARLSFHASLAAAPVTTEASGKKFSETQTHQMSARKEKQLETLRAALGICEGEDKFMLEENNPDEKPRVRRPFLDREIRTRHEDEQALREEDPSKAITPKKRDIGDRKNRDKSHAGHRKKKSKRKNPYYDEENSDPDDSTYSTDSSGRGRHTKRAKKNQKKADKSSPYYDEEDSGSDSEVSRKKRRRRKHNRSQVSDPSSDSEPYDIRHKHSKYSKTRKTHKRHRSSDDEKDTSSSDSAISSKTRKHTSHHHHHHMKETGILKQKTDYNKEEHRNSVGDTVTKHHRRQNIDNVDGPFSSDSDKRNRWVGKRHRGDDSEDKRGEGKSRRKSRGGSPVNRESRRRNDREEYKDTVNVKGGRGDGEYDD